MATAADLRAIEDDCPWLRPDFQAGLAALASGTAEASRRFASEMRLLARLAGQVPRCRFDETGATPWTSFRREVALARSVSDAAAAAEIRVAQALTGPLTRTMALLESGRMTVQRARALVREVEVYDVELAGRIDDALADKAAGLSTRRIEQEVRRLAATLDPDAAALRVGQKNTGRGVSLHPDADDQASVLLFGPAVPLTRWHATVDERARALKAAGDARTLDQLRFDLATSTYPCATHAQADPTAAPAESATTVETATTVGAEDVQATVADAESAAPAGQRPGFVEPAAADCRMSRPVQANVTVPVETALGLSNEPGWLDGYGWLSAPTCRLLLVDAELRRLCVQSGTGQLVDLAERDVRPPPTPTGVRQALVEMVTVPIVPSPIGSRFEPQHDPSPPLREYVELRDRFCDGPTGGHVAASRCDLDHDRPHPDGPTAAWNLVARSRRTHGLKHYGWTSLRTPTSTLWFSPAGQVIEVPHAQQPPPGVDSDPDYRPTALPDPDQLAATDQQQLQPRTDEPTHPWLPASERPTATDWTILAGSGAAPF